MSSERAKAFGTKRKFADFEHWGNAPDVQGWGDDDAEEGRHMAADEVEGSEDGGCVADGVGGSEGGCSAWSSSLFVLLELHCCTYSPQAHYS